MFVMKNALCLIQQKEIINRKIRKKHIDYRNIKRIVLYTKDFVNYFYDTRKSGKTDKTVKIV